ncbi:RNF213 [Mytilus edulis]|uniref:RNF213 n=1 Tax=Mytilus edulis TaxID=6550 RepID=A0A8S3Q0Z8_MYTED|nr:RNF213 [Mytilus edulis]
MHSIIISLTICYQSRFGDRAIREEYLDKLSSIMSVPSDVIANIITSKQEYILHKMEYLPEGTALNVALQENVFMLLVCILSKIPIFLVGKPGCSKSLSIQLLRSNLRGKDSANEFCKSMPQIFGVSFQGSESSTSEGIIKVFERAQKYQQSNDERDVLPVVILDEIGLAEISRFNPLKVLHDILEPGNQNVRRDINRNTSQFRGLPNELKNILEIFKKHVPCIAVAHVPVMKLIRENIKDYTSRHLMLITHGNVVISVLERELSEMKLPFDIIFGSNFEDDLNADYNYRILSRIILCMEQGMVLILKDLEAIYGSLYDMLNQSYTVVGKKKNCRVALGHYSNPMCHVHDDFKCIVLFSDLLKTEKLKTVVDEITHEITTLCQIQNYSFIPEEVIPSYSFDLIVSLVVQLNQTVDEEHIKDYAFERLLWLMPPEVVIRASESKYAKSNQHYMSEIIECFIIYTHSSLHSIIEDQFGGHQVQKQKIATFKSEKEFTASVENFLISDKSVFFLQCIAATEIQHTLLSKVIIEKAIRKCQQKCDNKQSTKHIYMIIHLDRGLHIHLPVNFLSSWNLLYMDSIQTPRTTLDYFLQVDKLEIVRERMPLHDYITSSLFLVLSRVKFTSRDNSTASLLEFLLKSLRSCKYAIDTLEEMIVSWIEKRSRSDNSGEWCVDVAKSPHDLIISGTLIGAIENNIREFIETPLSKYIFVMIDINMITPVIFEDEFTNLRRKSWKSVYYSQNF